MAVYWFDPYTSSKNINSLSANGIHGTINSTTRNGTYDYPFTYNDMVSCVSSTTALTAINGVNFNLGDELRIKGLPLTDFFYNTGTSGNTTSTGTSANTITVHNRSLNATLTVSNTSHRTALTNSKTYLNNMGYTCPAFLVWDNKILGNNKYFFTSFAYNYADTVGGLNQHTYVPPHYTYWYATARGNSDAYEARDIAMIDPKYYIGDSTTDTTARFMLAFVSLTSNTSNGAGITFTDGWTSSTTRGGSTILVIPRTSTATGQVNLFNGSSTSNIRNIDLPNTHIVMVPTGGTTDYVNATYNIRPTGLSNTAINNFGSYYTPNGYSNWNYLYSSTSLMENAKFSIGTVSHGYYAMIGGDNATTANTTMSMSNLFVNSSPLSQLNSIKQTLEFGHFMTYNQYSESCMFYGQGSNYVGKINFLANSFIYNYNSSYTFFNSYAYSSYRANITFSGNTYIYSDFGNSPYPYAFTNANTASPQLIGAFCPGNTPLIFGAKLNPVNFSDKISFRALNVSDYVFFGPTEINHTLGILDTGGLDYRTTNSNVQIVNSLYIDAGFFTSHNMNFPKNTYDNNIISLATPVTTSLTTSYPTMLCYNESSSNNDLCFQSNPAAAASGLYYRKGLMMALPDLTGKTTINVSCKVTTSNVFSSNSYVRLYLHYKTNANVYATTQLTGGFNNTGDTKVSNWSVVKSISTMETSVGYVGLTISVVPVGGYVNKYYFGNLSITAT